MLSFFHILSFYHCIDYTSCLLSFMVMSFLKELFLPVFWLSTRWVTACRFLILCRFNDKLSFFNIYRFFITMTINTSYLPSFFFSYCFWQNVIISLSLSLFNITPAYVVVFILCHFYDMLSFLYYVIFTTCCCFFKLTIDVSTTFRFP